MKPSPLTVIPLAASIAWVVALIIDPGSYSPISIALLGSGLLILATIGTIGLVLVGGRWSQRLLAATLGSTFVIAVIRPFDGASLGALALSSLGAVAIFTPRLQRLIRKLPSATGPPPDAVVVTLVALAAPLVLGVVPAEANLWAAAFCLISFASGAIYSQTIDGGLALIRYGTPLAALALAVPIGPAHGIPAIAIGATLAVLGRSGDVAVAFHPLTEKGTSYPVPPELAPGEILDGAGLDERGKPKG